LKGGTIVERTMKDKTPSDKIIEFVVNGCKVTLNFPPISDKSVLSDIKKIMLGGVLKS